MNLKMSTSLCFCFFLCLSAFAETREKTLILNYVHKHHEIAIKEMKRSGIPASILLAQAIIISKQGSTEMAVVNNNHFATKCGIGWNEKTMFLHQEESITESCFRAYPDAASSYRDYTDLLMKNLACRDLIQYSYYDYQSWANGIEHCMQVTDEAFAAKLIKLIKKYDLAKYDSPVAISPVLQKPIIGYEFEINKS